MSTEAIDPPVATSQNATATPELQAETPWHATIIDATKGELAPEWWTKAPEEERSEWMRYKDAKTPMDIAMKAAARVKEAQTELRNKKAADAGLPVRPEGDAATPEAMAEYYEKRGLPKDPTGYGLNKPEGFPDALWSDGEAQAFAKFFHDKEYSPAQVKELTEFTQQLALVNHAEHLKQQAALQAEMAAKRTAYVQGEQEALVGMFGQRVDPVLKGIEKIAAIAGLDPEHLNPKNPEMWLGANVIKAMESMVSLIPKTGDPTRRDMGPGQQGNVKDVNYWKNLPNEHPDRKAFENSADPRHKQVVAERNAAYALAAELNAK